MASKKQSELIKYWRDKGYYVINLINTTPIGLPDLACLKPNEVVFVESKEKTDRLSPLQKVRIKMLTKTGFKVYVNYEQCT